MKLDAQHGSIDWAMNNNIEFQDYNIRSLSCRSILAILFVLIVVLFVFGFRVLPRALDSSMDLKSIYIASVAWAKGLNPYDHKTLDKLWVERGNSIATASSLASVYPITTYSMLSILSALSWQNAKLLWLFLNICACFLIWSGLVKILRFNLSDWPSILLIAALLALSPVQNCIFQGQIVLVVLSLMVFSILFSRYRYDIFSGTLLGLALGLKPQISVFLWKDINSNQKPLKDSQFVYSHYSDYRHLSYH